MTNKWGNIVENMDKGRNFHKPIVKKHPFWKLVCFFDVRCCLTPSIPHHQNLMPKPLLGNSLGIQTSTAHNSPAGDTYNYCLQTSTASHLATHTNAFKMLLEKLLTHTAQEMENY
eukprot:284683-Amphidinium_carterae.1